MTRESIIVALGLASAAVAIGAAVASLLDFDALRRFADGLAPDGDVEVLARATDAQALAALRALAVVAALAAAMLLALRRSFFLASPPTRPAHAGNAKASAFALTIAGLVFVVGIALAWRNLATPVRVDEANAVLRFSSQSLWTVLNHYTSPQNHILHTLLVYVAHRLGGWEVVALRLPAFLAAILVLPAAWCFMRREHGRFAASLATALIATSPLFIEYAANARGHSLMTLFFLLSLLCAQRLLRQSDATGCWALFALCIALGLFTIPIMAFPAAVAVAWMLVVRWRQAGAAAMLPFAARTAAWSGAALALALILYAPVLAVSGYDALFQHKYAERTGVSWLDGPRLLQLAWNLTAVTWTNWHAATPVWAQATLATLVAIGAAAPDGTSGHISARGRSGLGGDAGGKADAAGNPVHHFPALRFNDDRRRRRGLAGRRGADPLLGERDRARCDSRAGRVGGAGLLRLVGDAARRGGVVQVGDGLVAIRAGIGGRHRACAATRGHPRVSSHVPRRGGLLPACRRPPFDADLQTAPAWNGSLRTGAPRRCGIPPREGGLRSRCARPPASMRLLVGFPGRWAGRIIDCLRRTRPSLSGR